MNNVGRRCGQILLLLVFCFTIPPLAEQPDSGLDPSWKLGMHLAREQGLVLGRDLFFTYGPWGFLSVPLTLVRPLWIAAAAYCLIMHVALFAALGVWMRRARWSPASTCAPLALLLFAPAVEYHALLALLLWVYLAVTSRIEPRLLGALLGAAGGATLMIKFSTGTAAAFVVASGIVSALWLGRRAAALCLGAGFCLGGLGSGLLSLGSLAALGRFLSVSWQIAASHYDALQRRGPLWQPWLMLFAAALSAAGIARSLRKGQPGRKDTLALLLPAVGVYLLACKHGFGRQETHVFYAFSTGSTLMTWVSVELRDRVGKLGRGLCLAGTAAMATGTFILSPPSRFLDLPRVPGARLREVRQAAGETLDPEQRARLRQDLRRRLPLSESIRNEVQGRRVDVLTGEIALVEAWGLRWAPRAILQSYIVSRSSLDGMDADWFSGPSAPERLLVDMQGVDTRHPFMDSPLAWRQILLRYEPLDQDDRWLLLGLRPHPRAAVLIPLGRFIAPLNQPIPAPQPESGHLEMEAILRPSLLGRLASIPWVQPEVRVGFVSPSRQPLRRILAGTAVHGFPVIDPWPNTPAELRSAFVDPHPASPLAVGFVTPSAWAWKKEVDVTFYQVTFQTSGTEERAAGKTAPPRAPGL